MKKVDYKTRLIHALAVSGLVLGGLGAVAPAAIQTFQAQAASVSTPVADDTSTRAITIHKYDGGVSTTSATGTDADADNLGARKPLANISFKIEKITPKDGAATKSMDASDPTTFDATTVGTITTNDQGEATQTLGDGRAADGYYLVTELASPAVKSDSIAAPFIVKVPLTQTDTNKKASLLYTVNVYPKNETETITLDPSKTLVGGAEDNKISVKAGADVKWNLTIDTPADLYQAAADGADAKYAKELKLVDPIDSSALTYDSAAGVQVVTLDEAGAELATLTQGDDYNVTETTDADLAGYNLVTIEFTEKGMEKAAGSAKIQATLTTKTTADASATILNTFDTYYIPSTGGEGTHETTVPDAKPDPDGDPVKPDKENPGTNPTVVYGNIDVLKTDDSTTPTPLANATFRLAASEDDAKNRNWITDVDGNPVQVTTDSEGKAEFTGLQVSQDVDDEGKATGTWSQKYYLVETDAPAGYDVDGQIHEVTATQDNTLDVTVQDADNPLPNLPMTGSDARLLLMVTATALIVGSGAMLYIKRRREAAQD